MKRILITNDDGIDSDGLIRLAKAAKQFGEVYVVAPDSQRSAMSHSITLRHSFRAWRYDFPVEGVHAYACEGTPADCVRIGTLNIVPGGADVVMAGINYGYNVATDLQYSATAGAAFEAAFRGIHAIAFSENFDICHEVTDRYLVELMNEALEKPLGENEIWNINFPGCPLAECKGIVRDALVSNDVFYEDSYAETSLADGSVEYMVVGNRRWEAEKNTDLGAILNNYVSIGKAKNIS